MKNMMSGPIREEATGSDAGGGTAAVATPPVPDPGSLATPSVPEPTPGSPPVDPGGLSTQGAPPPAAEPTWRDQLAVSDEVKAWNGYENIKDASDAVTQLFNSQKMLGGEKILKPQENWSELQWGEHFNSLGRPDASEGYNYPELTEDQQKMFDPDRMNGFKSVFHQLGLSQDQVDGVMSMFYNDSIEAVNKHHESGQASITKGLQDLKLEWGDSFDPNLDSARAAVRKLGGDPLVNELLRIGQDKNPILMKAFAQAGNDYMESATKGPASTGMFVTNETQALQRITELKRDPDWFKALHDPKNPAHAEVVQERLELMKIAHPTKEE